MRVRVRVCVCDSVCVSLRDGEGSFTRAITENVMLLNLIPPIKVWSSSHANLTVLASFCVFVGVLFLYVLCGVSCFFFY